MSTSKHFNKIAIAVALITLIITVFFMFGESFGIGVTSGDIGYENRLFDNSRVHKIDIVMNDFEEFINNAEREEYYTSTVVIDGEAYKNVAIRGKGNTSLSSVSSLGSDRYSFKIEFDHYDSSISYHGLDKLSLNNLIQDNTMMKDYVAYTAMAEFGVPSSLCSFVYITVNGEDFGLYLAVEGVEDSFLRRNYGNSYGELYKPDSMSFGGGRGNGRDFDMDTFMSENSLSDFAQNFKGSSFAQPDSSQKGSGGFFGGMGFGGMGSSDVKLQYTDDDINSYSNIWNNAKTDISEADQKRLINSLKLLSEGKDIESCVNITDVIRYFVVHNYVVNGDSYTGSMIHNYYLYEEEGILSMIPWDYNLAFGGFNSRDSVSSVNTAVDFTGMTDRPMVNFIFENEEYTELYHQYYQEFIDSVDIGKIIQDAYVLIDEYVEKGPVLFLRARPDTGLGSRTWTRVLRASPAQRGG